MKQAIIILLTCLQYFADAADTLLVNAPAYANEHAVLFVYDDLVTRRTVAKEVGRVSANGDVLLMFDLQATSRCQLRIGKVSAELYLTPGRSYHLFFPQAAPTESSVEPEFHNMDILDRNAMVSDLNHRIDAFLVEAWGMETVTDPKAVHDMTFAEEKPEGTSVGTHKGLPYSPAEVDTFEQKLNGFYADVNDLWFAHHVEYAMANLRVHPRIDRKELFERYITGKRIAYDDPEHIRFIQQYFDGQLIKGPFRSEETALRTAIKNAERTQLLDLITRNSLLEQDLQITELVLINELYAHYHRGEFNRSQLLACLKHLKETTSIPEHKKIIGNVIWDLTSMTKGTRFPNIELKDADDADMVSDTLLMGDTYLMLTREDCTRCEKEIAAMEQLNSEYGESIDFRIINIGPPSSSLQTYQAADDPMLLDKLRVRSLPTFFLLKDGVIQMPITLAPSEGIGATLHKIHVEKEKAGRVKVWDD